MTRGRPPTTQTQILTILNKGGWHTFPNTRRHNSALHRLRQKNLIKSTRPHPGTKAKHTLT